MEDFSMPKLSKIQATWLGGTQVDAEAREFKLRMDKPIEDNGTNSGPKPAEVTLQALGSCLIFAYLYAAQKLNVSLEGLKVNIEGESIPGGWTDENNNKHPGFKEVRFEVQVKTNHSEEEVQEVHNLALKASPQYDNFVRPVKVSGSFIIQ